MRIETHEIDSQARKIVPIALPRQWEFREVTGRDYGIDMELEIFEEKNATGQVLLFQIKGTEKDIVFQDGLASFDIPTKTLIYSERFVTPFVLAVCPINHEKQIFYYIWLQEYVKSVLNFDNPDWRNNKTTTRIKLLKNNIMPGNEQHLSHISHFPQRLYGACEVARILHNLRYTLDGEPLPCDYQETAEELQKVLHIPGYLSNQWNHGAFIQSQYLRPALLAAQLLATQREPTDEETKSLPLYTSLINATGDSGLMSKEEEIDFNLRGQLAHGIDCMSFFYEETNYAFKNTIWKEGGGHNF